MINTEQFKGGTLLTDECVIYNKKLLVTKAGALNILSITSRRFSILITNGLLPYHNHDSLYEVVYLIKFYEQYSKEVIPSQFIIERDVITPEQLEECDIEELDRQYKLEKVKIERVKYQELTGSLVKADDLDRTTAEQAILHKVNYMDDLEVLPTMLEKMERDEISTFLNNHYTKRMDDMRILLTKLYKDDKKILRTKLKKLFTHKVKK